jgi:hypothetical protein
MSENVEFVIWAINFKETSDWFHELIEHLKNLRSNKKYSSNEQPSLLNEPS